ncbi:McrC family protein [Sphingomonas sp. WKB10]|nr:McrC family protein [Sphingomonas sp. WKB10]
MPKIDVAGGSDIETTGNIRQRLVHMLAVALDLKIDAGQVTALDWQRETLLEILIRLFSEKLVDAVRQGMPRRYVEHADDLPTLRGRLNVTRQFTALAVEPSRLACRFDALTPDIALEPDHEGRGHAPVAYRPHHRQPAAVAGAGVRLRRYRRRAGFGIAVG